MTLSIAARFPEGNMFGVAIASSSPAVAARCAHARRGAGAVATQNITDPSLGPQILDGLEHGAGAREALEAALHSTPFGAYRQLIVVSREGVPVVHSGAKALGIVGSAVGVDAAAAGNLLARAEVPAAMVAAFEAEGRSISRRVVACASSPALRPAARLALSTPPGCSSCAM